LDLTTPCIDHGGKGNARGYKSCWFGGRYVGAHVKALIQKTGEQPVGRVARHLCNNSRCINSDHLAWGTQAENIRDSEGRPYSRVRTRVLSDSEVSAIRAEFSGAYGEQTALAKTYGVSRLAIHQIVRGKRRCGM
jgi:hypothetical protein